MALRMRQKNRPPSHLGLKIVAAILLGLAVIFALIALHGYLRLFLPGMAVNALFAGGFALLALGILAGVRIAQKRYQPPALGEKLRDDVDHAFVAPFVKLQDDIERNVQQHEKSWLLAAAVLGILLGARTRGKRRAPRKPA